jgi:hypothetical protein
LETFPDELVVGVLVAFSTISDSNPNYAFRFIYKWNSSISFATLAGAYIGESLEDHHNILTFILPFCY